MVIGLTKERDTLKAIQDFLDIQGHLYIRVNPISPTGRDGRIVCRRVRQSQRGAPDLIVFFPVGGMKCMPLAVEVKSAVGKLRPYQKAWQTRAAARGLRYCVVRSFEQFLGTIERVQGDGVDV